MRAAIAFLSVFALHYYFQEANAESVIRPTSAPSAAKLQKMKDLKEMLVREGPPSGRPDAVPYGKQQFVEQKDASLVRDALGVYYHDCGFYPDTLEKLFIPTKQQQICQHGTDIPPLASTPENKVTITKLTYVPFGYDDFELSVKLYWTRD